MTHSTKDQIAGNLHKVTGETKKKVGKAIDSPGLVAEGQDESTAGTIQKKIGKIEKALGS